MWTGIANFLFGGANTGTDETVKFEGDEIPNLKLLSAEEDDWIIVNKFDEAPAAMTRSEIKKEVRAHPVSEKQLTPHPGTRFTSVHLGQGSLQASKTHFHTQTTQKDRRRVGKRLSHKALEHSNKVYHCQSKCKRQRRYNHVLC